MKKTQFVLITCIAVLLLQLSISVSAQDLYTKESGCTDRPWTNDVEDDIPNGTTSYAGITGCDIDVNQCHPEISSSPYDNRAIQNDISIHTLGNSTVARSNFYKWSRWYQEDGNTQIFRLFKDEINVRNATFYKPRIEAEHSNHVNGTTVNNGAEYAEWSGTYTIIQPSTQNCNIFQIWGSNNYALMIEMRAGGKVVLNRRYGAGTKTMIDNATGKSFDIMVRDYGTKWVVYLNGEYFDEKDLTGSDTPDRDMQSHFRWGIYHSDADDGPIASDCMMFVTGARFRYSNQSINNNDNPQDCEEECTVHSIEGTIQAEDYCSASEGRTEDTDDAGGGENVGWIDAGEWLEYEVDVEKSGTYKVEYRVASKENNINLALKMDGSTINTINESTTGAWQTWETVTETINLSAGEQTMRIEALGSGWNINWIKFTLEEGISSDPEVSFITPSGDIALAEGYSELVVQVDADDADGTISYIDLYVDDTFIRKESVATYDWGHDGRTELLGMTVGVHYIKAIATDNDGNTGEAQIKVTITGDDVPAGDCEYPAMSSALSSIDNDFNYVYKTGTGYPELANFKKFGINWDLTYSGLYQFSINTTDGNPDYFIDLRSNVSNNTLDQSQPGLTVSGSPFAGFDGDYYVVMDGDNIVLSEKSGSYSLYFSNSATAPCPEFKSTPGVSKLNSSSVNIYPMPFDKEFFVEVQDASDVLSIEVYNSIGQIIQEVGGADVSDRTKISFDAKESVYFIRVNTSKGTVVKTVIKK